ncbi:MAG: hypothetical protein E6356_14795 [Terrisporobacter othiniensis]|uniref:Uncharacterized protein n=1 Tax=Terrisporobacter hibernicus TaxID=2813371 RepID=A0AAX2ZLM6_9FIRM|nr:MULTISPECIES: hypothetical protein [Terrisporobacter]MDU4862946.1 hypothetical protein [Terrisporobacter othiniensis]MDU6996128.1 hypothetical protein [Terrisporobacter othiniensis]UEL49215.1 hypothetical protein JW646_07155 [Terrisporobacter hibernicus]
MLKVINSIGSNIKTSDGKSASRCNKAAGAEKVYERKEYIILKVKKGYIVYNTKKVFENGHTHLQSFEMSKTIIDNSIRKKRPKTNNIYLIESHIRVTNDSKYKQTLEELVEAKKDKTKDNKYHNRSYFNAC